MFYSEGLGIAIAFFIWFCYLRIRLVPSKKIGGLAERVMLYITASSELQKS